MLRLLCWAFRCQAKIAFIIVKSHWRTGCGFAVPLLSFSACSSLTPFVSTHSRRAITPFTILSSSRARNHFRIQSVNMSLSSANNVRAQKQTLRKQIRARMKEMSSDEIAAQSAQVWERLFALPEYQQAKSVGLFLSMPKHEINTDAALIDALRNNKTVYVPQVGENFELADMELIQVILPEGASESDEIFHAQWPRNKWGIPEPPESMQRVAGQVGDIDLLVVPGLAFDSYGGRLGQGKGYYDRFIARMRNGPTNKPRLVAVGLEPQFVTHVDIPVTELDYTMDTILLPNQTVIVTK